MHKATPKIKVSKNKERFIFTILERSMMKPKISVIVPVFNVEKYLARCLDSLLRQTFEDFEVICVNDGSLDGCPAILSRYEKTDSRIKVIHQENQGLSVARNNGLKQASGEYVCFLDSDDALHSQALSIAFEFAEKYQAELVCYRYKSVDGNRVDNSYINEEKIDFKLTDRPVFQGCGKSAFSIPFSACTKLYRRNLLRGIEFIPHIHFEDYPFVYAILARSPKTVILDAALYLYTEAVSTSISHQKGSVQQIYDYHTGINFIYDIYKSDDLKKEFCFIRKDFIPIVLKHQLGRCQRADESMKQEMYDAFAEELCDLNKKGLLSWRGHKFKRYFAYKKLVKKWEKKHDS